MTLCVADPIWGVRLYSYTLADTSALWKFIEVQHWKRVWGH